MSFFINLVLGGIAMIIFSEVRLTHTIKETEGG